MFRTVPTMSVELATLADSLMLIVEPLDMSPAEVEYTWTNMQAVLNAKPLDN